jgi:hypothetical protein
MTLGGHSLDVDSARSIARPGATSGQARLTAWLRARAARDRVMALEEALLGGGFWRFAVRRLSVFVFARGWATALHVVELTFLSEIFVARPFVASLAFQNATLIADAFWWGALEALRRRLRAAGARAEAQVLTTRYMTAAFAAGLAGCCAPIAHMAWRWRAGSAPTMLDAYAFVCLLRLGLDMVLRAFYSGVYAYGRVHRPAWSAPIAPSILVGVTVALWSWCAGWSFVAALLLSVLASRALLLRFTLRAYKVSRVPRPAWRWRRWGARADWRLLGESALAGIANLTTRLAAVVLLGAVLPSLGSGADDQLQWVAYVLHLAAPLVLITSQWGFIFYHDWKRLEADVAAVLGRRLHLALLAVGVVVAVIAWSATVILVLAFAGWRWHWQWRVVAPVMAALAPAYLGLSIWTALQLRGFARGEFATQAISAVVVVAAVAASRAAVADPDAWYWTLAGCPWVAIAAHGLLARWLGSPRSRLPATLDGWVRSLRAQRGPLIVWRAELAGPRPAAVLEQVRRGLSPRGSAVPWRQWLLCYQPPSPDDAGPQALRQALQEALIVRCAGLLASVDVVHVGRGAVAPDQMERLGWLAAPDRGLDAGALEREHARLFPDGFILRVGRRPPGVFVALPADVRQAIWRDAIRRATGGRRRTSAASAAWNVTAFAPGGTLTHVFVAPRARPQAAEAADAGASPHRVWAEALKRAAWRVPGAPPAGAVTVGAGFGGV